MSIVSNPSEAPVDPRRIRLQAILALATGGRTVEAERAASDAIADGIEHPLTLSLAAGALERIGRDAEALPMLQRAAELAPQAPGMHNALGLNLRRLGRDDAALTAYDAALIADPNFVPALTNRAAIRLDRAALRAARADFETALAIDPANIVALAGLAGLAIRRGRPAEARTLAAAAIAREPGFPGAVIALAEADLAERRPADAMPRLDALLRDHRVAPLDKAIAMGLTGDVHDALGDSAQAYIGYSEANDAFAALRPVDPAPQPLLRAIERELIPRRYAPRRYRGPPGPARGHVFLVGFPRSGTTLLEQILEQHPDTVTLAEKECLVEAVRIGMTDVRSFADFCAMPDAPLAALRDDYWRRVRAEGADPTDRVFIDKHPFHSFKLPLIARLFPDATILFARRDPRDVVLSCFRRRFRANAVTAQFRTLTSAADLYDATMALDEATRRVFALDPVEVRLEDLIQNFDRETRRICARLELMWTDELAAFAEQVGDRDVFTPSGPQLARGLNAEGVGRWRDYAKPLAPVLPMLGRWAERLGYV